MIFLVIVDAHSKWPEVIIMHSKTTTFKTVEALRTVFARNGLLEQLVSDNDPQFTAEEFQLFLKKKGVKHVTSARYHPATNGLAERFIQTMKQSLTSMKEDLGSMQTKLSKFLMKYRNTPHMGRNLRTRLDLIKPDIRKHDKSAKPNPKVLLLVMHVNYSLGRQ
jgi:transposase InsO family protein